MPRIQYHKPAHETYDDVVSAIRRIGGSLQNASQLTGTVTALVETSEGFFEGVRTSDLRVYIIEVGSGTCLIEAEAVGGYLPAPEVIDLLIKALNDPKYIYKPWFRKDRQEGWAKPIFISIGLAIFVLILILL